MIRPPSLLAAAAALFLAAGFAPAARALEECRLLRQPDIEGDRIVFVYAGDLWAVARAGGVATRLTTHDGVERFPQLSPDGATVAFTAEYDGNIDVYSLPMTGGEPTRLTWHPAPDQVAGWYPDGKHILFRSVRASAPTRFDRFFKIAAAGGFEEMLALPTAGYCSFSPDARRIAFVSPSYDNRTWKRYKGGNAPNIWIYDFAANQSEKMTDWAGADEWPMWHGSTVYYSSDRGGRTVNLWAYDVEKKTHRQVTTFTDYDVKWPSLGSNAIVFENGGYLYVMDLPGEKATRIKVLVPDDKPGARAEVRNVAQWITDWDLSPSAKRAVLAARGDLFTVPAEHGDPRNLTQTPGARERNPAWSPDGKWVAYLSDESGEYELHVIGSDGKTPARQVTRGGGTFRFAPQWSPDSKKLVFSDKTMTLWWCEVASGKLTRVDQNEWGEIFDYNWAPDSRWIVYSRTNAAGFNRLMLYDLGAAPRLLLAPAARGAAVLAVAGWTGPINHTNQVAPLVTILRSWEDRFGVRLVGLGFDTLELSVAAPPTTPGHAVQVAADRGIHVDGVSVVVHFDVPASDKDYVHRSGRTGRAGASGVVVSLVTDQDHATVDAFQRVLGLPRGLHPLDYDHLTSDVAPMPVAVRLERWCVPPLAIR